MLQLPLQSILFWIAVTLAPQDTSQILVKGPDATWAWTKQTTGWSFSANRSIWATEGNTVTTSKKEKDGKKVEDVGQYVQGVKDYDWKKSDTLNLQPNASLAKEGETFVYTLDEGTAAAKRYLIRFRRLPAPGKILSYEIIPASVLAGISTADRENLRKAVDRRLNSGLEKLAWVRSLEDGRFEVALLRRSDADTQRVERLLARQGRLEFRILASKRQDKAVVEQAKKDSSKTEVLDPADKRLAWWVPVKADEEKSLNGDTDIVRRTSVQGNREIAEILVVTDPYDVTGAYLTQATAGTDGEQPCINFTFSDAGGQLFLKLTGGHLPNADFRYRLGIILDGELCSAPRLNSAISDKGKITSVFAKEQAADLADVLNGGSLPFRLRLASGSKRATETSDKGR
jgi:hypothetical protein